MQLEDFTHFMPMPSGTVAAIHISTGEVTIFNEAVSAAILHSEPRHVINALMQGRQPKKPADIEEPPKLKLRKEFEMDLTDLLMALFKKQPRVVGSGYFRSEPCNGGRLAEREHAVARDMHFIYFEGTRLGRVTCQGHKELHLLAIKNQGRVRYAQGILEKLTPILLPKVRIIDGRKDQDREPEEALRYGYGAYRSPQPLRWESSVTMSTSSNFFGIDEEDDD